ncbi:short-chain dehydrogenase [Rhizoctonia solani AG-1 IA]|uniref:Short-chain dehydrogenase n=1 Tax=Thanatephorus cucumeris (strain AG1-IA) TaxID=983506 RepID=L8WQM2_THACA|nr:short-chain dehydrogenase [Rhizoctonia solani AG-1 IA]
MSHFLAKTVYDVSGRIALVTGGGTGIGLMITQALAANGAKVYIGSRRNEVIEKAADEHGNKLQGEVIPIELDVTDKGSIKKAVEIIQKNDGNAGRSGPKSPFFLDESAPENKDPHTLGTLSLAMINTVMVSEWSQLYTINASSIFFVTTAFLGLLHKASEERGAWSAGIINTSSISGQMKRSQNHFAYNSAKAASIHLTKMFSTELAIKGIPVRVNSISPGMFPSEMTGHQGQYMSGEKADSIGKGITGVPMKRGGSETDIAGVALFLASPASYYITGQIVTVDGGYIATNPATS